MANDPPTPRPVPVIVNDLIDCADRGLPLRCSDLCDELVAAVRAERLPADHEPADGDAAALLELLLSDCNGANEHAWRKCRRCMAMHLLEQRSAFTMQLLRTAIERLKS